MRTILFALLGSLAFAAGVRLALEPGQALLGLLLGLSGIILLTISTSDWAWGSVQDCDIHHGSDVDVDRLS